MKILARLVSLLKAIVLPSAPAFTCGDCARNAQCGLEPSDACLVRIAQMSSGRGKPRQTMVGY